MPVPQAEILHTDTFESQLLEIGSPWLVNRVEELETLLESMPDMGSPLLRTSVTRRYGKGIRKLVAGNYDIIYRHTGERVIMLAAIPARLIR